MLNDVNDCFFFAHILKNCNAIVHCTVLVGQQSFFVCRNVCLEGELTINVLNCCEFSLGCLLSGFSIDLHSVLSVFENCELIRDCLDIPLRLYDSWNR